MAEHLLFKVGWSGFSLLFVVTGLYLANTGRKRWERSRRVAGTETTAIRDLQPGTAEVKGTADLAGGATLLESPLSKRDALATRVLVEEYHSSSEGGGNWKCIYEETDSVRTTVDDGTGEATVDLPADGDLEVELTRTKVGPGEEPPAAIRQYVEGETDLDAATRREIGPLSVGDRRRYSHGEVEPGESVYVLGNAREEPGDWGERNFVIDEPTPAGDFILSDKSEQTLVEENRSGGLLLLAFGAVFALSGAMFTTVPWFLF